MVMTPMLSDGHLTILASVIVAAIGIVPGTLAAIWSRKAKTNSEGALHEVKANGGMSDPDPTLKDYIKYVGENGEHLSRRVNNLEVLLDEHLKHSRIMDRALAEVFMTVRPELDLDLGDDDFP